MMNQAASATRRSPADSTATAGCCPMFNAPFFGLTTSAAAPQCFLSSQAQQLVQLARQPQQQSNVVLPPQQQTVSQPPPTVVGQHQARQAQPLQPTSQRSQDHTSNNYSTSISAPNLSLQHLLANRHSASSCMALAAALASASFPHFQQQQPLTQNHQATPINQPTQTVAPSTTVNPVTQSNATPTLTNQVPILNYNSYPSAQPFINLPALAVPQTAPPVAAHLSSSNGHQQQANNIPTIVPTNLNTIAQSALSNSASNLQQNGQQPRPLVANAALNSSAGQQQASIYRNPQQQPAEPNVHQQQPSTPSPAQQLGQVTRSILSDEALNSLFNDQFQAILLNQLFSSHQFAPSLATSTGQVQTQQITAPQQPVNNSSRTQPSLPLTGQAPVVMTSAQPVAPSQNAPSQQPHQQASEPVSESHQQVLHHSTIESRVVQAPTTTTNDSYPSSVSNTANSLYQSQQNNDSTVRRSPVDSIIQSHQVQQTITQPPPSLQPQNHQQQPQQPQTSIPPIPFYTFPQMEQALALLTNPQVANNIFSHVFNIYLQSGLRSEPHHTHHHHHPPHHFHHHLHGAHHHHHHGQNGQSNGQDGSMPLDSLAINESKPRGLNRAEIDSLTPYIHTNEKDARTCVICLSKFELKSKIRPLPCNHAFHAKCVDKWLRANRTCPICRRDALKTFNGKIKRV